MKIVLFFFFIKKNNCDVKHYHLKLLTSKVNFPISGHKNVDIKSLNPSSKSCNKYFLTLTIAYT